ncbi:MAG: tandem-95 repeat protein [Kofleriaceae bacterium]|nr:tandem-95 repeat protein [Kofleriaceae bacterium]
MKRLAWSGLVLSVLTLIACAGDPVPDDDPTSTAAQPLAGEDGTGTIAIANTVVNAYASLAADAASGDATITVDDATLLTTAALGPVGRGDLLMVIQMQGATISSANNAAYGTVSSLGGAGNYELVFATGVAGNQITLAAPLRNAYRIAGHTQVVRVPQYQRLEVTAAGSITAPAWNGSRGGVVAVYVHDDAQLDGPIDVTGRGFRGGATDNAASTNNATAYRTAADTDGAAKGEGIAGFATDYDGLGGRYGRGAPANGGGGGNAHNGGGGGGANGDDGNVWTGHGVMSNTVVGAAAWALDPAYVANGNARTTSSGGGRGGYTYASANRNALTEGPGNTNWGGDNRRELGGRGGHPLTNDPVGGVLFMGGGGGAGDGNNGGAGAGGAGGGIVLVIADAVTGTAAVRTDGAAGTDTGAGGNDAPGGGGGGGSLVIRANAIDGVTMAANGGVGGNQHMICCGNESEGPGGGGGGGFVATSTTTATRSATRGVSGTSDSAGVTEFPVNGSTHGGGGQVVDLGGELPFTFDADLAITVDDGVAVVTPGAVVTYTVAVTFADGAPIPVAGAHVVDVVPASLTGVTWTCAATAGSSCPAAAGVGSIDALVDLLRDGTVTFTITGTLDATASGALTNSASVAAPAGVWDPDLTNNGASDTTDIDTQPVAVDDGATVAEDGSVVVAVLGNDSGLGDPPLVVTATDPAHGSVVVNADGTVTYTPDADYYGPDTFDYTVTDADGDASTATVTVDVTPTNDVPVAVADSATVAEDGTVVVAVLGNDTGLGDPPLVVTATDPAHGTVVVNADGTVTYTPDADYHGPDAFTYTVTDADGDASTATVTIAVTPVNDTPVAVADTATVDEGTSVTVAVLSNDTGLGDAPLVVTATDPPHGTVVVNADGTVTYTPDPGYQGADVFDYTVTDADGQASTATVTIDVTPVDTTPVAVDDAATVAEDAAVTIDVLGNDSGLGDTPVTVTATAPAHGTVVVNADGTVTYTPDADYHGADTFAYTVTDVDGDASTATVTIDVTPVDDTPVAVDDAATVAEDGAVTVAVLDNDSGLGDAPVTVTTTDPAHGTVVVNADGTVTYTPDADYHGPDAFDYTVTDADGQASTATVTIDVTSVNDAPVAVDDATSTPTSTAVVVAVLDNDRDVDGDALTVTATTTPGHGTVAINGDGTVTYTPTASFEGTDTFTYTVSDGQGGTATATVTVSVGSDRDGDGLSDATEEQLGTDPDDADSDDDGILDGDEPDWWEDSDGDGLINPLDPDSDNDGLYDGTEVGVTTPSPDTDVGAGHFVPDGDAGATTTDPLDPDTDGGGVLDGAEDVNGNGVVDAGEIDPNDPSDDATVSDRDGDGLTDAVEEEIGSDPDDADTDDDGVRDGDEPNWRDDTDGDGVINVLDPDSDDDGLFDGTELGITEPDPDTDVDAGHFIPDGDAGATTTNPLDADTDDGGVSDGDEDANHDGVVDEGERDPNDPSDDQPVDPDPDTDGDGVPDALDDCPDVGDPDQVDSDGDGLGDACDPDADGDGFVDDVGVSGGGCDAGGGGATGGAAIALLALLALGGRRRRVALTGAAVVATTALATAPARAQTMEAGTFPVERFRLSTDRDGLLDVEWAESPGRWAFDLGLWAGYANDPLVIYRDDADREVLGALVGDRIGGDLVGSLGITDWLAIGLDVPLILYQGRDAANPAAPMGLAPISSFGLGDLRLSPKLVVLRQARAGVSVAIIPAFTAPSSTQDDAYFGDTGATFAPEVAVSRTFGAVRASANLGLRLRGASQVANLVVDDELFARAGVGYRFASRPLELDATMSAATALADPLAVSNQDHLELLAGGSYQVSAPIQAFTGAGVGLDHGFGTPDWRVVAGLRFGRAAAHGPGDRDHDGLRDADDACPTQPEDRDGFQDEDGCPDPDNDGDGVLDVDDGAPMDPEDRDGWQDADGVPDPDNDGDGVLDADDGCPDEVGVVDNQGCPWGDGDADGLTDDVDRCPAEAEDADGFADDDGCPDPDNDEDGVLDRVDACPDEPGPAANQGCPDTDRDGDGVVDRLDNCPDEKGTAKNQGCADKQLVKITDQKLEILDTVYFKTDKDIIEKRSYKLLDNLARVIVAQGQLRIRVEGHTDNVGDDAYNKDLSQRRAEAVMRYLTSHGVDADRLEAIGYGEERPIASNKTKKGRASNRRVEFVIISGAETEFQDQNSGPTDDTIDR